ncbi:cupin domain-containing protein [Zhouia sp. PK063]|uniref:cupin domain-containing protein n=1 Tax=Zhouia sp. PK063 TaxID=3373602 RepID=UPI00378B24F3
MNKEATQIIEKLHLEPHPEGGYFKEVYRSKEHIKQHYLPKEFGGDRNYCTSIYFLLPSSSFSAFHSIHQDEIWHFYKGDAIELHMISPDGHYQKVVIGNDLLKDEVLQFTVPAQYWFAAKVIKPNSFALVGCTVAPGFDFQDFTLASKRVMLQKYPQHQKIIEKFCIAS